MPPTHPLNRSRLVAIVGGSGAGKTWLANRLQETFGDTCARVCLDDFYLDRSHLSLARRARLNFDHPRAIDWPLLEFVLSQCQPGRSVCLPRYDFTKHRRLAEGQVWESKPLVLVEGLWLLRRRSVRRFFDLSIFVDCSERMRFERRLRRDVLERQRTEESVRRQFAGTVAPMHKRFVEPQARWADLRLGGGLSSATLAGLVRRLRALLK